MQHADQVTERQVAVGDESFELVELGEVRRVEILVSEDAIDREQLGRLELFLQTNTPKHCVTSTILERLTQYIHRANDVSQ